MGHTENSHSGKLKMKGRKKSMNQDEWKNKMNKEKQIQALKKQNGKHTIT